MSDLEIRQRLQASTYGEGRQLVKWINSPEVLERLSDPSIHNYPAGTTILQSGPWVVSRNVSLNTNAMTAGILVSERNDEFTVLGVAIRHPSFQQLAVILRLPVSNDVLRACAPSSRKTLAQHIVSAMSMGLSSNGIVSIRGPLLATHSISNQQLYRRDAWLVETVQGIIRKHELLFSYGA